MRNVLDTMYRLTERGDAGPACDDNGVTLGPVILVEAVAAGGRRAYRSRSSEEIAHASHFNSLSGENVPLKIEADVKVQTQDETVSRHYTWTIALPPGGLAYAPLKDIPPLKGPGNIEVRVKNLGPFDTAVSLRTNKADPGAGR